MKTKLLLLSGIFAPIVYVGTVILGGAIRPDYSHIAQPVSDLIASGAANKALLDPLFAIYNILVVMFAVGLLLSIRSEAQSKRIRLGSIGAVILVLEGLFGFITLFFPEDAGPISEMTSTGQMHIVFAGLSSVTTMVTMLLIGIWLRSVASLKRYGVYSFISLLVVFVAGGLAAVSVANHSPLGGLIERITIGGFIQWLFVIGWTLYNAYSTKVIQPSLSI